MRRALTAGVVAVLLAGCGGGQHDHEADLTWQGTPRVFVSPGKPADRIAVAQVRNAGTATARIAATDVVVRDADGRRLDSTAQFAAGYAHGLWGAYQRPSPMPPGELTRLGLTVAIAPGRTAPLTVAWHTPAGARLPLRVDYGGRTLTLPRAAAPGLPLAR